MDQIQIQIQIHGLKFDQIQIQIQIRRICICICICKYKYVFDPSPGTHSFLFEGSSLVKWFGSRCAVGWQSSCLTTSCWLIIPVFSITCAYITDDITWMAHCLKSTQSRVQHLLGTNNKLNIKAPHYWPSLRGIHWWPMDSIYRYLNKLQHVKHIDAMASSCLMLNITAGKW